MNKKIILKGYIFEDYDDIFRTIFLRQKDGYGINLISRIKESVYNYGKKVAIKYYTAEKRQSKEKLMEGFLNKLMGNIEAEFETEEYSYSEMTQGCDYNTIFNVSNHNLYRELSNNKGKYLYLEIEFLEEQKNEQ